MSSITEKLQQIKIAKDLMVTALLSAGMENSHISAIANNVSSLVGLQKQTSALVDEISAKADQISAVAEEISAKATEAFKKSTTAYYANYITQDMADFLSVDEPGYYPNGSPSRAKFSNYVSYIYQAKEDFDIWGEQSDMSASSAYQYRVMTIYNKGVQPYTAGGGQRYRVQANGSPVNGSGAGDRAYPTASDPYHVKAGQYIVFSHDSVANNGGEYSPFLWRTSIPMPYGDIIAGSISLKYQKTDIRTENNVHYQLSAKSNQSSVEQLYLCAPARNGFVEWSMEHIVCLTGNTGNTNNWHLWLTKDRDRTKILKNGLTRDGEVEMAIQLKDRPDFIGGRMHGDEVMRNVSLSVDGVPAQMSSFMNTWSQCKTVSIFQESRMYDPSLSINLTAVTDDTPYVATHAKTLTFYKDTLSIDQTVIWNGDYAISKAYMPMITPKKYELKNGLSVVITDGIFTPLSSYDLPHDWESHSIPSYTFQNTKKITVYGKEKQIMMPAECVQYINGSEISTAVTVMDNGGNNYNKCYFNLLGDARAKAVSAGDVWTSRAEIKILA